MGHVRLGTLPTSRNWQHVVDLIAEGGDVSEVAAASTDAAENALNHAADDPALVHAYWLLTQIPLAARTADFGAALRALGLPVEDRPTLMETIAAYSEAVDRHARYMGGRTDLGEMVQLAAAESLTTMAGRDLPGLFGSSPEDAKLAFGRLSATRQFGLLAQDFFARLTRRHLEYYLSRELPNQVGAGRPLQSLADHSAFDTALDIHCRESARIVREFSGDWFSKKTFDGTLSPEEAKRFLYVAFKKVRSELRKRSEGDG